MDDTFRRPQGQSTHFSHSKDCDGTGCKDALGLLEAYSHEAFKYFLGLPQVENLYHKIKYTGLGSSVAGAKMTAYAFQAGFDNGAVCAHRMLEEWLQSLILDLKTNDLVTGRIKVLRRLEFMLEEWQHE